MYVTQSSRLKKNPAENATGEFNFDLWISMVSAWMFVVQMGAVLGEKVVWRVRFVCRE